MDSSEATSSGLSEDESSTSSSSSDSEVRNEKRQEDQRKKKKEKKKKKKKKIQTSGKSDKKKKKSSNWTSDEEKDLVTLRTDPEWEEKFRSAKRRAGYVWSRLADKLVKKCDAVQAKNKWESIRKAYKKIKKDLRSGDEGVEWPLWNLMKIYMEPRPTENPTFVNDSENVEYDGEYSVTQEETEETLPVDTSSPTVEVELSQPTLTKTMKSASRKRKSKESVDDALISFLAEQKEESNKDRVLLDKMVNILGGLVETLSRPSSHPPPPQFFPWTNPHMYPPFSSNPEFPANLNPNIQTNNNNNDK